MVIFFVSFLDFFLYFLLILAGVQYDTARSLSRGWAGLPNHPSLIQQQRAPVLGPPPPVPELSGLLRSQTFTCTKHRRTV